jgi:hypothetical protein
MVGIFPEGGVIAGTALFYNLGGNQVKDQNVVKNPAAMMARISSLENDSRSKNLLALRDIFTEAARYKVHQGELKNFPFLYPRLRSVEDYEAVLKVLEREIPLVIQVNRAADIEAAVKLSEDFGFNLILASAIESWKVAEKLGKRKIPVIVFPVNNLPESFDIINARSDLAGVLEKNEVPVIISTFDAHKVRMLRQLAGIAVREGMTYSGAIASISSLPAKVFGLSKTGSIKEGYRANLVLWEGDPLEISTQVKMLLVDGKSMPLTSRQTDLFKRYRQLDQNLYLHP